MSQWRERDSITGARVSAVPHGVLGGILPQSKQFRAPFTFLFFGRIEAYKGLDILVQAVEMLSARSLEFRVIIAGIGPDLDKHRDSLLRLRSVEIIERFVPSVEVPILFQRSEAVVLPYKEASQSGVAAMSFAAGLPVIATYVGALSDVVKHDYNGLLIEPDDPEALCGAMESFIQDTALYTRVRVGARRTATGPLSWSEIAKATSSVYVNASEYRLSECI